MTVLDAIVLGLLQGLTEFLPISSSGHLILFGKLLGVQNVPLAFELLTHLATLAAVLICLRKPVLTLVKKPFQKTTLLLIIATVPTVVIFLVFKAFFESAFDGRYLPYAFGATAVLLLASEFFGGAKKAVLSPKPTGGITVTDALILGVVQGLSGLPGISRSGVTISAGRLLGQERKIAAEFSFLLSIPIILGSCAWGLTGGAFSLDISVWVTIAGFLAAFISGLLCVKFMLHFVAKHSMNGFAVYLLLLTAFLILDRFWLGLF